jgi:hypothetical protein
MSCLICQLEGHESDACPGFTVKGEDGVTYRTKALNGADIWLLSTVLQQDDRHLAREFRQGTITRAMLRMGLRALDETAGKVPAKHRLEWGATRRRFEAELKGRADA